MKLAGLDAYREVWCADFEFHQPDGERPAPICLVARELRTGRLLRLFGDKLTALSESPVPTGADVLFIAYYASAEFSCYVALDWLMPQRALDLFCEFKCLTAGLPVRCGYSLLGALTYHGLDAIDAAEKDSMRALCQRGSPFTDGERSALLDYCQSDVDSLARLLPRMLSKIDLPRALLRGRYMQAAARMEWTGIPIDVASLTLLRENWAGIQDQLIGEIDTDYGVFDGRTFKADRFATWLARNNIPWPRLPSGALALDDDTFREMARSHPAVAPIRELRVSLSQMRLSDLTVGRDGRNRCLLSAFRSITGRNQPSNSRFIFGPAVWLRSLIQPESGKALVHVDWSQQEFGIGAALSGDENMRDAYSSGDPYLGFAVQAGAAPADATRATHGHIREQYKACAIAMQYGMGAESLATRINQPTAAARELLRKHRETYQTFWRWSDGAVDHAMLTSSLQTVFGWTVHVGERPNPLSFRNFLMQANGAEMLRLACCLMTEGGITVCAPVHDAVLVEGPLDQIEDVVTAAQGAMCEASEVVLDGFSLRSEAKIVRYPDRYLDPRGERMWKTVTDIIHRLNVYLKQPPPSPANVPFRVHPPVLETVC